jgi:hypothetical protein
MQQSLRKERPAPIAIGASGRFYTALWSRTTGIRIRPQHQKNRKKENRS